MAIPRYAPFSRRRLGTFGLRAGAGARSGIEVLVASKDDLDTVLKNEALAALRRKKLSTGLMPLAWVQTDAAAKIEWVQVAVKLPSLKERAVAGERDDETSKKSVLQAVASQFMRSAIRPGV